METNDKDKLTTEELEKISQLLKTIDKDNSFKRAKESADNCMVLKSENEKVKNLDKNNKSTS